MDKEKLYTLITRGNAFQLEAALQAGLNANATLPSGEPMIIAAACMGDTRLEMTKILAEHGANINAPIGGMTLLKWIKQPSYCDNKGTIAFLKSKGAKEMDIQ